MTKLHRLVANRKYCRKRIVQQAQSKVTVYIKVFVAYFVENGFLWVSFHRIVNAKFQECSLFCNRKQYTDYNRKIWTLTRKMKKCYTLTFCFQNRSSAMPVFSKHERMVTWKLLVCYPKGFFLSQSNKIFCNLFKKIGTVCF